MMNATSKDMKNLIKYFVAPFLILIMVGLAYLKAQAQSNSLAPGSQTTLSSSVPSSTDTEPGFASNEFLVKVKASTKKFVKSKPSALDTGVSSWNTLNKKHKAAKFEKIAKAGKKSKADAGVFDWYKVTLPYAKKVLTKKSPISDSASLFMAMRDYGKDSLVAAVEKNFVVSAFVIGLGVSKTSVTPGELIDVWWSNPTASDFNWIGFARPGLPALRDYPFFYTFGARVGTKPLAVPAQIGAYDLVYHSAYAELYRLRGAVVVSAPASTITISPSKNSAASGELINVAWTNIGAANLLDRIGFALPGQPGLVTYFYTEGLAAGTKLLAAPAQIGAYDLVYQNSGFAELYRLTSALTVGPKDPYYFSSGAWGQSWPDLWSLQKIDAAGAWTQTTGSADIIVADIDTGVDRNHPDLAQNMWVNAAEIPYNGFDDDRNGYIDDYYGWDFVNNDNDPMDDHGHGTHTAGTIAAVGNNGLGVVGVNWTSRIMALKFLSAGGSGYLEDSIKALQYAADMGARVSSNSWGCWCWSQALDDAIKYEHDQGMVTVAAAGNFDSETYYTSPASSEYAITVSATNHNDAKASFSNRGEKIDVAAPGGDRADPFFAPDSIDDYVLSLRASSNNMCGSGNTVGTDYCFVRGTSMAAPHVAGLAALLLAKNPVLNNEEVRQILRQGADDLGATGQDPDFGFGRINAQKTLNLANTHPLTPVITSPRDKDFFRFGSITVIGSIGGPNLASYKVELGAGFAPREWVLIVLSPAQVVTNQVLAVINENQIYDGVNLIRLTAFDTAGRTYQFQVPVVFDNTSPQVRITDPKNGDTFTGWMLFLAQVSDNTFIKEVQFQMDGINIGEFTDMSVPNNLLAGIFWDTGQVKNGPHVLTAIASDWAGNVGFSPPISVTVNNPAPPNPISPNLAGYWAFDEASGPWAYDSSGNNRTGFLVNNPTWVNGRMNGGLSFNGTNNYVDVPVLSPNHITISLWFKAGPQTNSQGGLFGQSAAAPPNDPGSFIPTLWILPDGRLRGELWNGAVGAIYSSGSVADGQWHMATIVGDDNSQHLYLDGQEVGIPRSGAIYQDWWTSTQIGTGFIGYRETAPETWGYLNGAIDDVRIYDGALTAQQVLDLYQSAPPIDTTPPLVYISSPFPGAVVSGEVLVTADAKDPWSGKTPPSGVVSVQFKLDGLNLGAEASSSPDYFYSVSWDTTQTPNGSHTLTAEARDGAGNIGVSAPVVVTVNNLTPTPALAPQNYWTFDEGSGQWAYDSSGNNRTGFLVNNPTWVNGRMNGGLSFNGTNNYVDVPVLSPNRITISLWFKAGPQTNSQGGLFGQSAAAPPNDPGSFVPSLWILPDGRLRGELWNGTLGAIYTPGSVADGNWHMATIVGDDNSQHLYLDGQEVGIPRSGAIYQDWWTSTQIGTGFIGYRETAPPTWGYLNGVIDDVRIYESVLNSEQVLELYQSFTTSPFPGILP